jgi:hypothetical protein
MLVPLVILAAVFPAAALSAAAGKEPSDGSMTMRDGRGKLTLVIKGSLIGRFANGTLKIEDLDRGGGNDPVVRGYKTVKWGRGNSPTYSGKNVRFRLIGGRYRVTFTGKGLFFSLVARGRVQIDGNGSLGDGIFYDGFYSLNGSEEESLPDDPTWISLVPSPPPPPSSSTQPSG